MALTPLDIRKHTFAQKLRGVDPVEVEQFLALASEELARRLEDLERLERDNRQLSARLAETENQADAIAGLDLSSEPRDVVGILVDLARRETKAFSQQFARSLVGQLKKTARLHQSPMRSAGFVVLKAHDVPSVLVELGYVSNKEDLKQLMSGAWRTRTARSIVQAVDTFFSTRLAGTPARAR